MRLQQMRSEKMYAKIGKKQKKNKNRPKQK